MKAYETSATVQDQGKVNLSGVPFAPGTRVSITVIPALRSDQAPSSPGDGAGRPGAGLRWQGGVLVHDGVGADASVGELRDERLDRFGMGPAR